jgi:hypothetical protein
MKLFATEIGPEMNYFRLRSTGLILAGLLLLFTLAACQGGTPSGNGNLPAAGQSPSAGDPGSSPAPGTGISIDEARAAWTFGPHAETFVVTDAGKNSTCARCHSPVNWVPTMEDMPESCTTCKFTVEPPPPYIAPENWDGLQCNVCHQADRRGNLQFEPRFAWLEIAAIRQYAAVESASELCQKCHAGILLEGHKPSVLLEGVHADKVCTECHDSHSAAASCAACHEETLAGLDVPGHDADHRNVTCAACHDAAGLEVGPDEQGLWRTYSAVDAAGEALRLAVTSHNLQRQAACDRCHFNGNPWGLEVEVGP